MNINNYRFSDLTTDQLYALLHLRTEVFVVEQNCAYSELDGFDQQAMHILGTDSEGNLVAYARILPPQSVYEEASTGRVAVEKNARHKGYGRGIFAYALDLAIAIHPSQPIKIQAQLYLEDFYKSFGFTTISEPYPDWGIWHVDMVWEK